jgi:hypothetical protein
VASAAYFSVNYAAHALLPRETTLLRARGITFKLYRCRCRYNTLRQALPAILPEAGAPLGYEHSAWR